MGEGAWPCIGQHNFRKLVVIRIRITSEIKYVVPSLPISRHGPPDRCICSVVAMTAAAIAGISQSATLNCRDVMFDDDADDSAATTHK